VKKVKKTKDRLLKKVGGDLIKKPFRMLINYTLNIDIAILSERYVVFANADKCPFFLNKHPYFSHAPVVKDTSWSLILSRNGLVRL